LDPYVYLPNISLWIIFGKDRFDDAFIEDKIREIVAYATPKKVEVVLYPHSSNYFEASEEALVSADKIDHPNLTIAFHLYHDIRAGHGSRIPEVFENIKHRQRRRQQTHLRAG
jgi:sugar phosphate isomerase/epimerase